MAQPILSQTVWHLTRMYEKAVSQSNFRRSEKEHLTRKIDGFDGLATLFERLDKLGGVSFNWHANF